MFLRSARPLFSVSRIAFPSYKSIYLDTPGAIPRRVNVVKIIDSDQASSEKINSFLAKGGTKYHLSNIPPKISVTQFSKMLSSNGIQFKKIKKGFGKPHAKIQFDNLDQAKRMLGRVSNVHINEKKIYVNVNTVQVSEMRISDKRVEEVTTPWWNVPYEEQLERKKKIAEDVLRNAAQQVIQMNANSGITWIEELNNKAKEEERYSSICPLHEVFPSPKQTGYRNKIAFTVGHDATGRIALGYVMGKFKEGIIHVGNPADAVNSPIHPTALHLRGLYEDYFKNETKLPIYDRVTNEGFWRAVEMRTFNTGECAITFQVKVTGVSPDEIEDEMGKLVQIVTVNPQYKGNVSLFIQEWNTSSGAPPLDSVLKLVHGKPYVHETLAVEGVPTPLTFRVQPTAFFQPNTSGCEVLYSLLVSSCKNFIKDRNSDEENLTVLDLCCGTGTIGLSIASALPKAKVLGIDIVEASIQDALHNMKLNHITSAEYIQGDIRNHISSLTKSVKEGTCIAIADPPRGGLHPKVLKTLIETESIDHLIYVACNPLTLANALPDLCKRYRPVNAFVVDLFPQTEQLEMVVCFDKIN